MVTALLAGFDTVLLTGGALYLLAITMVGHAPTRASSAGASDPSGQVIPSVSEAVVSS